MNLDCDFWMKYAKTNLVDTQFVQPIAETNNKKKIVIFISVIVVFFIAIFALLAYRYLRLEPSPLVAGQLVFVNEAAESEAQSQTQEISLQESKTPVEYTVESVATGLSVPWSIVFTSPNRLLVTERPGRVRVIEKGILQEQPIRVFPEVLTTSEEGLMGMTLDPNYEQNKHIFMCIAYEKTTEDTNRTTTGNTNGAVKVIRLTDAGDALTDDVIVIDNIPAARFHAGCRVRFGPDGKLYISTGDATNKESAQDMNSLAGKMLRLNSDGTIPSDNPFANSPIFSLGHRNSQGFDWHPETGVLVATEHGPTGNDGPGGGDEVNVIQAGKNYGWPIVSHEKSQTGLVDPALIFTPAVAPASGMFYSGPAFPQLQNTFLFGALRGEGIIQVVFDSTDTTQIVSYQKLAGIDAGRVRDIVEGPDGLIYFTTSNTDSRGRPRVGDDQVMRLVPKVDGQPFRELTIPFLRSREYSSQVGELTQVSTNQNYTSFTTNYTSDGLNINALLTQPTGQMPDGGWPAIVFIHGYIPPTQYRTQEKYVEYVDYLARNGFVVFKIDLRGHGQSDGEAGGAYYSSDYIIDTLNAYSALQTSSFVNPEKIGLWGHSMAGNVIMRSVAVKPEIPAAVVWGGAVFTYADFLEFGISDGSYMPPGNATERQRRRQKLFDTYGTFDLAHYFWSKVSPVIYLGEIKTAMQFQHAVNDNVVDVEYSRNIHELLLANGVSSELFEYSLGGHNITSPSFGTAMSRTVEFYKENLR